MEIRRRVAHSMPEEEGFSGQAPLEDDLGLPAGRDVAGASPTGLRLGEQGRAAEVPKGLAVSDQILEERLRSLERLRAQLPRIEADLAAAGSRFHRSLADAALLPGCDLLARGPVGVWFSKASNVDSGSERIHPDLLRTSHACLGRIQDGDLEASCQALQARQWSPNGEGLALLAAFGLIHESMAQGDAFQMPDGTVWVLGQGGFRVASAEDPEWFATFRREFREILASAPSGITTKELASRIQMSAGEQIGLRAQVDLGFDPQEAVARMLARLRREHAVQSLWTPAGDAAIWRLRQPGEAFVLTAYEVSRRYGGPEEGGWHYDHYSVLGTRAVTTETALEAEREMLERVRASRAAARVRIEVKAEAPGAAGEMATLETPRYE